MYFKKLNEDKLEALAINAITESISIFQKNFGIVNPDVFKNLEVFNGCFKKFYALGREYSCVEAESGFEAIKNYGSFVQRHLISGNGEEALKGTLFCMGLLVSAVGKLDALGVNPITEEYISAVISDYTRNLVLKDFYFLTQKSDAKTKGEEQFALNGRKGARGEAEKGYGTYLNMLVDIKDNALKSGREQALNSLFLIITETLDDTNLKENDLTRLRYLVKEEGGNEDLSDFIKSIESKPNGIIAVLSLCIFCLKFIYNI